MKRLYFSAKKAAATAPAGRLAAGAVLLLAAVGTVGVSQDLGPFTDRAAGITSDDPWTSVRAGQADDPWTSAPTGQEDDPWTSVRAAGHADDPWTSAPAGQEDDPWT